MTQIPEVTGLGMKIKLQGFLVQREGRLPLLEASSVPESKTLAKEVIMESAGEYDTAIEHQEVLSSGPQHLRRTWAQ